MNPVVCKISPSYEEPSIQKYQYQHPINLCYYGFTMPSLLLSSLPPPLSSPSSPLPPNHHRHDHNSLISVGVLNAAVFTGVK
jgi:hypothetical protein